MTCRCIARACFGLLAFYGCASADNTVSLQSLMQHFASVRVLEATFHEEKHLAVLSEPLVAKGVLTYKAPDYLKKEVTAPSAQTFTITGDEFIRDGRRSLSLSDHPQALAIVEAFRATLHGDVDTLKQHYAIEFEARELEWLMILVPKDGRVLATLKHIVIEGRDEHVNSVTTLESDGDSTVMTLEVVAVD